MAGQTKQILYSPVDVDDADFVDFERDPLAEAENAEFEKFKSEMHESQDQAKITVSKKMTDSRGRPIGKQMFECFECGIDEYDFSQICTRIREDFGTGLYQILGRNSKGAYKFRKTVGVLAPNSIDNKPAQNDVGALIDKFSDAMERQQMRTEQLFSKIAGPQTGGDAIDQISKLALAIGPILKVMGIGQPPVPPKTLVEQLTEFKMIKELFGGGDDDGYAGEANLYSLLGETIKAFGGPLASAIAAGAKAGDLNSDGLAVQGRLPAPEPKTEQSIMQEKQKMEMRKNIHILIQNAKTKIPPASFALILVNNTPEDKTDALWDFISAENCIDEIVKLEPAAEMYRPWFVELRNEVINLLAEPDSDDENSDLQESETGRNLGGDHAVAGVDDVASHNKSETASDPDDSDTPSDT